MAVLEAVRGWDALKPAEASEETTSEDAPTSETAEIEETWTDDRINELKKTDPLSVLLEHERHVGGTDSDEITGVRESPSLSMISCVPMVLMPSAASLCFRPVHPRRTFTHIPLGSRHYPRQLVCSRPPQAQQPATWRYGNRSDHTIHGLNLISFLQVLNQKRRSKPTNEPKTPSVTPSASFRTKRLHSRNCSILRQASDRRVNGGNSRTPALARILGSTHIPSVSLGRRRRGLTMADPIPWGECHPHFRGAIGSAETCYCSNFKAWSRNKDYSPGQVGYYSTQYYEGGAKCWNGPERSVRVRHSPQVPPLLQM